MPVTDTLSSVRLSDDIDRITAVPQSIFIIPDAARKYEFPTIIKEIENGQIARHAADSSIINLGAQGEPIWVIIPVRNNSSQDVWSFSFGTSQSGRLGLAEKAILYESTSGRTFFNTTKTEAGAHLSSTIPVTLKRGAISHLIFYIQGQKGSLTSFEPGFYSSANGSSSLAIFEPQAKLFFMAAIFILLTGFFFSRDVSLLPLAAMWLVFFFQRSLLDHFFLIDSAFGQMVGPLCRVILPSFLFVSLWLNPDIKGRYPPSLFIGTGILFLICAIMSLILPSAAPVLGIALSYAPVIGISLITAFASWPLVFTQTVNRVAGLALISMYFFLVSFWAVIETIHPVSSLGLFVTIVPWTMAAVAVLSALVQVRHSEERVPINLPPIRNDFDSSAESIREAREASEHTRLLQVLDQERAMMKEMQLQEARQTEEMKRSKEYADEANMAKSAFLAVVSHEIRTPMTGVMGMVRLMLETGLSREQKEYAHTIQDSCEALLSLLNDILDFEKIESGKLELEKTNFDLKRLLKGVHTLMNGHAASKNVELVLDMDPNLPDFVVGDPTRLRQVLLNLVNNAIKFTARGAVTIHVKNLTDTDNAKVMSQIYFGIQDSGIGISAEAQKKIFTPFAQADASITRKFGGTGLGLTICKRLIDAMGSSIGINSREGEGSTFFFTLQMQSAKSDGKYPQTIASILETNSRKLRVLIVDDNGINQKVIQSLLTRGGHQSVVASNVDDCMIELQKGNFDLVLMDIELPGKSGIDATHEIRALPDKARSAIPVVAMTGNVSEDDIKKYLANGMNDFIGKPVMPENLQKILLKAGRGDYFTVNQPSPVLKNDKPAETFPDLKDMLEESPEDEDIFASAVREFEKTENKPAALSELDEALVASLIKSLGAGPTADLMKDFYLKTEELIEAIENAGTARDAEALHARAHELKGMAANFGFKTLAANAAQIEKQASDASESDLRPLIKTLPELYRASFTEMEKRLNSQ